MFGNFLKKMFGTQNERTLGRIRPTVDRVNALASSFGSLPADRLAAKIAEFRQRVENGEPLDDLLPETFAVVREAGKRAFDMRHFDVQLMGGVILHEGRISEMRTGEGKTLVATLPIVLNYLTGRGVHLVTVNDYLARRDADWMGKLYRFLGMTVGVIVHGMDDTERQASYRCDITYGTNNEFGFDYLRDNMKFRVEDMVQRDLHYAIVDEVDSILIDEARTPLIISGPAEESTSFYARVNSVIPFLKKDADYTVDEKARQVLLTEDAGIPKLEHLLSVDNLYDPGNIEVLHHVNQALKAHILFQRDVDYMVKDGEVVIVDEFTGRLMPGRRWSDGLHQAVEAKEGVKIENENQTLATITFQNYFRMFDKLAGMTGTADTEAAEFQQIYKLAVTIVPTNQLMIRQDLSDQIYRTEKEKFNAVLEEVKELHTQGRPVLVGTVSIETSERLSGLLTRLGDDLRLLLVVLGIQNVVGDAVAREQPGEPLGFLDRHGSHQYRPPLRVQLLDLLEDRVEFLLLRPVDLVGEVLPDHQLVRRHDGYGELVDLLELGRLGVGGPGHAGQLVEHAEVVLEGDGRQRLVLVLDLDPLLGLHRLVETVGPAPPRHEPPGELVDDDDLAVLHHVVDVPVEQDVGLERLVHVVEHLDVARVVEVVHRQETFELGNPRLLGEEHLAGLFVDRVVGVLLEERDDGVHPRVEGGGLLRGAGDDERRPRLVDQDRVDLVHDRVMEVPLDHVLHPELHVVPEVVEAELVVRPVGDVAPVGRLALRVVHPVDDDAHGHPEKAVKLPHPVGVAPGEVVVHRHEVDAPPGQGVQDDREGGHERLPLAGPHLGDAALVEDHAAHQLDVEVAHVEDALPGLPDDSERFGEEVVQRFAVLNPLAEFRDLRGQPVVGERADRRLERVHPVHGRADPVDDPLVLRAKHLFQEVSEHDGAPRTIRQFRKRAWFTGRPFTRTS